MKKITRFDYSALKTDEVQWFNAQVRQILSQTCGMSDSVIAKFGDAASTYDALLVTNKLPKDSLSLQALDTAVDDLWTAVYHQLRASVLHPNATIRAAALAVDEVFSQTPNPTRLGYAQEYGALHSLLSRLATLDQATLQAANVLELITALQNAVADFDAAYALVVDVKAKTEVGQLRDARIACRNAWQSLMHYLEVMHEHDTVAKSGEAIDQLSVVTQELKQRILARKAQ